MSVSTGAGTKGIDAALAPAESSHPNGGSIEGQVTALATGLPLGGALVCAIPGSGTCALTASNGTYSIANLPAGDYKVEFNDGPGFQIQFYDEASSIATATTVHIAGEAKAIGINAKLKAFVPAPQLPGGIQTQSPTESGTPAPGGSVLPAKTVVPSVTAGGRVRVSGRRASVKLDCTLGPCHGTVELAITVTRRTRSHGHTVTRHVTLVVGSAGFSLAQGASGNATVRLTARGARLLATAARHPRAGKLKLVLQGARRDAAHRRRPLGARARSSSAASFAGARANHASVTTSSSSGRPIALEPHEHGGVPVEVRGGEEHLRLGGAERLLGVQVLDARPEDRPLGASAPSSSTSFARSGRSQTNSFPPTRHCRRSRETRSSLPGSEDAIRRTSSKLRQRAQRLAEREVRHLLEGLQRVRRALARAARRRSSRC